MLNTAATVFLIIFSAQSVQQITMQSWGGCVKAADALAPHFQRAACITTTGETHVGRR